MLRSQSSIEESHRRFQNIMTEKLYLELQGPIYQALSQESIYTVSNLVTLQDKDIEELQYTVMLKMEEGELASTTSLPLLRNKGWIGALIKFVKHHQLQSAEEFENTSIEEFDKFRLTEYNAEAYFQPSNTPNYNRSNPKHKVKDNALVSFKRAIKKDKSQYNNGIVGTGPPKQLHVSTIARKFLMRHTFQTEMKKRNCSLRNKCLCMQ